MWWDETSHVAQILNLTELTRGQTGLRGHHLRPARRNVHWYGLCLKVGDCDTWHWSVLQVTPLSGNPQTNLPYTAVFPPSTSKTPVVENGKQRPLPKPTASPLPQLRLRPWLSQSQLRPTPILLLKLQSIRYAFPPSRCALTRKMPQVDTEIACKELGWVDGARPSQAMPNHTGWREKWDGSPPLELQDILMVNHPTASLKDLWVLMRRTTALGGARR